MNDKYFRIKLILQFQKSVQEVRANLQHQMIAHAADDTTVMRRYRMLEQLSRFEADTIRKIRHFQPDTAADFNIECLTPALQIFNNRAA